MKLHHRFLRAILFAAVAGALLVALGSITLLRTAVRERSLQRIGAEAALLADWVARDGGTQDYQALTDTAARRLAIRVTLIAADGVVLADSSRDPQTVAAMENHLERPEIQGARLRGNAVDLRTSATTRLRYFYAAQRVEGAGSVKYVRLALPASEIDRLERAYEWSIGAIVFVVVLALSLLAYVAVRRLSRPLEAMAAAVDRAADGESPLDLSLDDEHEVGRLGSALYRLQQTLLGKIADVDAERKLLSSVITGMREGLLLVGADRRVRLANGALRALLDSPLEPAGRMLEEVVRHPMVLRDVESALATGEEVRDSIVRQSGSGRSFQIQVTPIRSATTGQIDAVLVLFFEITRLETLEGMRRDFVANVSHELRTPLTSIKAFVETLLDGAPDDASDARRFLEIIRKHSDRMSALIEDLTDLSLIETGSISLEPFDVDAGEVVREVLDQLRPVADQAEVELSTELARPFPVRGDRRRLEQMLTNLVDNGIKFNRPGGHVRVRGEIDEAAVRVVVEDDGIGIPADSREKVFRRFHRVSPDRSREAGGTGLGLAIVKHLMRLHSGRVRLESEIGQGTRVVLEFPRSETPAAE